MTYWLCRYVDYIVLLIDFLKSHYYRIKSRTRCIFEFLFDVLTYCFYFYISFIVFREVLVSVFFSYLALSRLGFNFSIIFMICSSHETLLTYYFLQWCRLDHRKVKKMFLMEGYKFYFDQPMIDGFERWRCSRRKCRSSLKTSLDFSIVEMKIVHNHEACTYKQLSKLRELELRSVCDRSESSDSTMIINPKSDVLQCGWIWELVICVDCLLWY